MTRAIRRRRERDVFHSPKRGKDRRASAPTPSRQKRSSPSLSPLLDRRRDELEEQSASIFHRRVEERHHETRARALPRLRGPRRPGPDDVPALPPVRLRVGTLRGRDAKRIVRRATRHEPSRRVRIRCEPRLSASRRSSFSAAASSAAAVHRHASRADGTRHAPPRGSQASSVAATSFGSVASSRLRSGPSSFSDACFFAAACAASADAFSASSRSRFRADRLSFTSSGSSNAPGSADQLTSLSPPSLSSALGSAAGGGPPKSKSTRDPDGAPRRPRSTRADDRRTDPRRRAVRVVRAGLSGRHRPRPPPSESRRVWTARTRATVRTASRRRRLWSPSPSRSRSASSRSSSLALEGAFRFPRVCFAGSVSGLGSASSRATAASRPDRVSGHLGPNLPWRIMRATRSSTGSVYLVLNGAETPGARVESEGAADASTRLGGAGHAPAPAASRDRAPLRLGPSTRHHLAERDPPALARAVHHQVQADKLGDQPLVHALPRVGTLRDALDDAGSAKSQRRRPRRRGWIGFPSGSGGNGNGAGAALGPRDRARAPADPRNSRGRHHSWTPSRRRVTRIGAPRSAGAHACAEP